MWYVIRKKLIGPLLLIRRITEGRLIHKNISQFVSNSEPYFWCGSKLALMAVKNNSSPMECASCFHFML